MSDSNSLENLCTVTLVCSYSHQIICLVFSVVKSDELDGSKDTGLQIIGLFDLVS